MHAALRARSTGKSGWRIVVPLTLSVLNDADHVANALRARGGVGTNSINCSTGFGAEIYTSLWCSNHCSKLGYYALRNGSRRETRRRGCITIRCVDPYWPSAIGRWPRWPWAAVWSFCWFHHRLSHRGICDWVGHGTRTNECADFILYRFIHGRCDRPLHPGRHRHGHGFGQIVDGGIWPCFGLCHWRFGKGRRLRLRDTSDLSRAT